ncbi:MAG: helix-turn-helix domain-containing protein [Acidobacteria bacterium]|nr:helix-turn-helix domain-containing protein [Acidobacteriota bacterium]
MKKEHLKLSKADRETLTSLLAKGSLKARAFKRVTGLLELDRGKTLKEVAETLSVDYNAIARWRDSYNRDGIECLNDKPRSGRPIVIDGQQRAKVTALACSDAPEGHARWSLRLLAEKVVELGHCDSLSHTQVGNILKKRSQAPSQPNVVYRATRRRVPGANGATVSPLRFAL